MSGIYINSDAWNFWLFPPEAITEQHVKADVDFYTASGGVAAIFYNLNFQRAFFPSRVITPIWQDCQLNKAGELLLRGEKTADEYIPLVENSRKMWEICPEWLRIRYQYCHQKGVKMFHSVRVNDVHYTPLGFEHRPQHSELWRLRKDLIRAWYRHTWRGDWHDNAFDYGQEEVRQYHLALVKEYLFEYESDGIELDFLRSIPLFKPGFDDTNREVLSNFMRRVRQLANLAAEHWGHEISIAVRVPYRVTEALNCGMDIAQWAREKLVDIVIPGPNNTNSESGERVDLWRMLLPEETILAPCIDCTILANDDFRYQQDFDLETDTGLTAVYYGQGADTIYCYNHFPVHQYPGIEDFFGFAGCRSEVEKRARRHVVTRHDPVGEGAYPELCFPPEIWSNCCNGSFKINAGKVSQLRKCKLRVGFKKPAKIKLLLNTVECEITGSNVNKSKYDQDIYMVNAAVPPGVLHDNWNAVEIFNCDEKSIFASDIVWGEIFIEAEG